MPGLGLGLDAEGVARTGQDAFAEVYELDVEGDVNRVLFALPRALTGAPDRPAAGALRAPAESASEPEGGAPDGGEGGRARRGAAGAAGAAGEVGAAAGAPWGSQRWAAGLAAGLARLAEECAAAAGREGAASGGVGAGVGALVRLNVQEHLRRLQPAK